ncbi:hypothetical protein JCM10512_4004 [Bacteroides reticulotermitis JCM 10512]|uniref:Uncharacterized protein n=1 Tax=Bacteroides reticulotermitis JCM 10512 TaxID=1445607 RepID=W4UY92_9BACE|nr:hypothetical protein JCM10512_4004 [Bacteroides reticulotermitis JCM 10512]
MDLLNIVGVLHEEDLGFVVLVQFRGINGFEHDAFPVEQVDIHHFDKPIGVDHAFNRLQVIEYRLYEQDH